MSGSKVKEECDLFFKSMRESMFVFDEDARFIVSKLLTIVSNVVKYPGVAKYRDIRTGNKTMIRLTQMYAPTLDFLTIVGFKRVISENQEHMYLDVKEEDETTVETALNALKQVAMELGIPNKEIPATSRYKPGELQRVREEREKASSDFDVYKPMISNQGNAPTSDGGYSRKEKQVEALKQKRDALLAEAGIPNRDLRVFPQGKGYTSREPTGKVLSDEQVKRTAMKNIVKKNKAASQFQTKADRDLRELQNAKVYTVTRMKIQLPDRTIITASFSPLERIGDVREVVAKCFIDSGLQFSFYMTPPMRNFTDEMVLKDEGLSPGARLYLKWLGDPPQKKYLANVAQAAGEVAHPKGHKLVIEEKEKPKQQLSEKEREAKRKKKEERLLKLMLPK